MLDASIEEKYSQINVTYSSFVLLEITAQFAFQMRIIGTFYFTGKMLWGIFMIMSACVLHKNSAKIRTKFTSYGCFFFVAEQRFFSFKKTKFWVYFNGFLKSVSVCNVYNLDQLDTKLMHQIYCKKRDITRLAVK